MKETGVVVYYFNTNSWEAEAGVSPWVQDHSGLQSQFKLIQGYSETISQTTTTKKKKRRKVERNWMERSKSARGNEEEVEKIR